MREFRKQLLLDITTEGLRIQIVDDKNRPMFALARAELEPHTSEILRKLGGVLNEMPNKVSLSGHTDATALCERRKELQQLGVVGRPGQRLAARTYPGRHE